MRIATSSAGWRHDSQPTTIAATSNRPLPPEP